MIERVTDGVRDGRRPGVKLLAIGRIAGAQALSHTVGAHRTPFVMVTLQPDVIQVFETVIFGNLLRRQMAVVVENRLIFCIVVVQAASKFGI